MLNAKIIREAREVLSPEDFKVEEHWIELFKLPTPFPPWKLWDRTYFDPRSENFYVVAIHGTDDPVVIYNEISFWLYAIIDLVQRYRVLEPDLRQYRKQATKRANQLRSVLVKHGIQSDFESYELELAHQQIPVAGHLIPGQTKDGN